MIRILPELKECMYSMSAYEKDNLERSIIEEGCRDALIVWGDILVDGHNRYEICTRHNIPFITRSVSFNDVEEAKEWIIRNQLSRRNLTDEQKKYLIGKRMMAQKNQGRRRDLTSPQNDEKLETSKKIADEFGISKATVERNQAYAKAVDTIGENLGDSVKTKILSGDIKLTDKDTTNLAKEDPQTQSIIIDLISKGEVKRIREVKPEPEDPIDIAYDEKTKEIDAMNKRVKKVMNLLDYTKHLGITEQHLREYFEMFPNNYESFIWDLERLTSIVKEVKEIYWEITKIRRIK